MAISFCEHFSRLNSRRTEGRLFTFGSHVLDEEKDRLKCFGHEKKLLCANCGTAQESRLWIISGAKTRRRTGISEIIL